MAGWRFHVETFGCKVNQYESQALREAWEALGGCACPDSASAADADVICINSCAVTARAERDARNAVFRYRRLAPGARIILTGCAAGLFPTFRPRRNAPHAQPDLCVTNAHKATLLAGPWDIGSVAQPVPPYPPFAIRRYCRARAVLKVQDGCAHRCTYCIVPQTRGMPKSRPPRAILEEARRLLEAGHAELVISGVNLNQYGRDCPDFGDFWQMLRALDAALAPDYAGRARLRLSSLEPSQLDARGLETIASCRMLCPHLHISLQHASQDVLRRMGRGHYTTAMLDDALKTLSRHWPCMGLGADILVGFPGERETDFALLLDCLSRLPLSYAHVFPYSVRPGTAAASFAPQVPVRVRNERAARVRALVAGARGAFLQRQRMLPVFQVALDDPDDASPGDLSGATAGDDNNAGQTRKGVNEYYVPCVFRSWPRRQRGPGRALIAAKAVGIAGASLVVEPLSGE